MDVTEALQRLSEAIDGVPSSDEHNGGLRRTGEILLQRSWESPEQFREADEIPGLEEAWSVLSDEEEFGKQGGLDAAELLSLFFSAGPGNSCVETIRAHDLPDSRRIYSMRRDGNTLDDPGVFLIAVADRPSDNADWAVIEEYLSEAGGINARLVVCSPSSTEFWTALPVERLRPLLATALREAMKADECGGYWDEQEAPEDLDPGSDDWLAWAVDSVL